MAGEIDTLPLIDAKLHRSWVSDDLVLRPRLVDRLNRGLDRRLTLVCATAGYDNTTPLTQWLADSPRPLTREVQDNHPPVSGTEFAALSISLLHLAPAFSLLTRTIFRIADLT